MIDDIGYSPKNYIPYSYRRVNPCYKLKWLFNTWGFGRQYVMSLYPLLETIGEGYNREDVEWVLRSGALRKLVNTNYLLRFSVSNYEKLEREIFKKEPSVTTKMRSAILLLEREGYRITPPS